MAQKNQTFESSLGELEKIVRKLEDGDLSLEESLKLFEDGVRLSRECQERLSKAERRIEILLKDEKGNPILQEINGDDGDDGDEPRAPKIKRRIVFDDDDAADESPF
jgi:exodeoxyribonuclease VII small subunit